MSNPACRDDFGKAAVFGGEDRQHTGGGLSLACEGEDVDLERTERANSARAKYGEEENMTFRHTPEMGEISGFGGGYEDACQDMLEAGVKWLEENKQADLKGHDFKNITGIFEPDSDDAKALSKVVTDACKDCTGAMHHAVMRRLFFIAGKGWDEYREAVIKQVELNKRFDGYKDEKH